MCDCLGYIPLLNVSNYIQSKRNRILYDEYVRKNLGISVCNKKYSEPKNKYSSYQLKQNIEMGCLYNEYCKHKDNCKTN